MDVLLWTGWACSLVVALFIAVIAAFGSMAMRSPRWQVEFHNAAVIECRRRGLLVDAPSEREWQNIRRLLGDGTLPEVEDPVARDRIVSAVRALVGAEDGVALEDELARRSDELLAAALARQFRSTATIVAPSTASRVWMVQRQLNAIRVLHHGMTWFLPRCFAQLRRMIERYMLVATIFGIVGGLLVWGFGDFGGRTEGSGLSWVEFIGVVVTCSTVLALTVAVGRQFATVIVAIAGPVALWTKKGVLATGSFLVIAIGALVLVRTGAIVQWQQDLTTFASEHLRNTPLSYQVTGGLVAAAMAWIAVRAFKRATCRRLAIGDRIESANAGVVVSLLVVLMILFVFRMPNVVLLPVAFAFGLSMLVLAGAPVVRAILTWSHKYSIVRREGIAVRRGWFRWWAFGVWCGAQLLFLLVAFVPVQAYALFGSVASTVTAWAAVGLFLGLFWSFWPGLVAALRFAARVNYAWERGRFDRAREVWEASSAPVAESGVQNRRP